MMPYDYATERDSLFTDAGQRMFLRVRDNAKKLLSAAGAVRCEELISCTAGDSWTMLACVDRLVELGEIREVTQPNTVAGQDRIFTKY
jgi:hypothetical protein